MGLGRVPEWNRVVQLGYWSSPSQDRGNWKVLERERGKKGAEDMFKRKTGPSGLVLCPTGEGKRTCQGPGLQPWVSER